MKAGYDLSPPSANLFGLRMKNIPEKTTSNVIVIVNVQHVVWVYINQTFFWFYCTLMIFLHSYYSNKTNSRIKFPYLKCQI